MNWAGWAVVTVLVFDAIVTIFLVGKKRKAITHEGSLLNLMVCAAIIYAVFHYWGVR